MKLIQILPNIYGVKVPSDAVEIKEWYWSTESEFKDAIDYEINGVEENIHIYFPFKIIGFLTKNEISFDASEFVEFKIKNNIKLCWNFKTEKWNLNPEQSFRSALPEDIYFENHFEKPNENTITDRDGFKKFENYYKNQENITHKLLILQKV